MNKFIEELGDDALKILMRILQGLNGILITLGGVMVYVHGAYPTIEAQLLGALPTWLQFAALGVIGFSVHYLTRKAKELGK